MRSRFGSYALTVALCLAVLFVVLEVWRADPRVPLRYLDRDSAIFGLMAKSIVESGGILHNPRLGAPFALDYRDYPFADAFHLLALRALSVFVSDWGSLLNLYYSLSFPLVAIASLLALRSLGVSAPSAVVASVLFAFLPYHLHPTRGIQHLFLSCYHAVPLVTLLLLRIASGRAVFHRRGRSPLRRTAATIAIVLVVASSGVYYAFFACFLLLVAGALAWRRGRRRSAAAALALTALVAAVVAVQMAPVALHSLRHGANPGVASRDPGESELFGLKIAQLLLPVDGHRLPALARLKESYNRYAPLNENGSASLGAIGAFGFLFLLLRLLLGGGRRGAEPSDGEALANLAVFNAAALLLGTIGGFGSLFAVVVSPQLRAWSRISVFIAYFSLFSVALLLDRARRPFASNDPHGAGARISLALFALLLVAGVADQTSPAFVPPYESDRRAFRHDADFVGAIETALPAAAMVFQLPYVPFPEHPPVHGMRDYEHLRGYLHSRTLRWSYASIKGRGADAWQREAARKPPAELLHTLALAGFAGVYVDRRGYADRAADLERELAAAGARAAAVSGDGNLVFFDLLPFARELREQLSPSAWREASEEALRQPLVFHWSGCAKPEGGAQRYWRWCGAAARLTILNPGPEARRAGLEMVVATARPEPSRLVIEGGDLSQALVVHDAGTPFTATLNVPPTSLVLRFRCDAAPVVVADDPRELTFRVTDFRAAEIR
jgi:phosphoglycerol transferase